jgi:hypothetical protein
MRRYVWLSDEQWAVMEPLLPQVHTLSLPLIFNAIEKHLGIPRPIPERIVAPLELEDACGSRRGDSLRTPDGRVCLPTAIRGCYGHQRAFLVQGNS